MTVGHSADVYTTPLQRVAVPLGLPVQVREPVASAGGHGGLMPCLLRPPTHTHAGQGTAHHTQAGPRQEAAPFLQHITNVISI